MNEPFRLTPVTVALDIYRRGLDAILAGLTTAGHRAWPVVRRELRHLRSAGRRVVRPSGELMPSAIGQRLRTARTR